VWIKIVWSEEDEEHIGLHGVSRRDVDAVLLARPFVRRAGLRYIVIGIAGPRTLFAVIERLGPTSRLGRVVTARVATLAEKRLLARRGKGSR